MKDEIKCQSEKDPYPRAMPGGKKAMMGTKMHGV
jgi:hypothetical protein